MSAARAHRAGTRWAWREECRSGVRRGKEERGRRKGSLVQRDYHAVGHSHVHAHAATDTASRVAAVTSAIGVAPGLATAASGAATAGPNFTLLDEDEEEEGASLATKRQVSGP